MSLLEADTGGNIVNLVRPNCSQLFFVYAGAMGQVEGMNQMTFLQRSGLLRRNVTFVRDQDSRFFENGVSADLPDVDAVLDWHRDYVDSLDHVTEVYSLGNSFGGWAALFFGYMLAVKKVLALSPAGPTGLPLLAELMKTDNGVTDYDIFYSRDIETDKVFAETFDGYARVNLVTREEHGHLMMRGLLNTGELQEILPEFAEAETAA